MCIAIYQPEGTERISKDTLKGCADVNPHGMGIAYQTRNGIKIYRTMNNLNELWNRYTSAHESHSNILLHFRLATRGAKSLQNCHPMFCGDDLVFAHNGTISTSLSTNMGVRSDTRYFRDNFLWALDPDWIYDADIVKLVENAIGYANKMVFMNGDGDHVILNEDLGVWDNDIWWSNNNYLMSGGYTKSYGTKYTKGSRDSTEDSGTSIMKPEQYCRKCGESNDHWTDECEKSLTSSDGAGFVMEDDEGVPMWVPEDSDIIEEGLIYEDKVLCYGCLEEGADDDKCMPLYEETLAPYCESCGMLLTDNNPMLVHQRNSR